MDYANWMALRSYGKNLEPFFSYNNIKSIAIWGCGHLGSLLYEEVIAYGIDIRYCIDRKISNFCGLSVFKPSQLAEFSDVDLVILCYGGSVWDEESSNMLRGAGINYITIAQIIQICFYKEVLIPYCIVKELSVYILYRPKHALLNNLSPQETAISKMKPTPEDLSNNPPYLQYIFDTVCEYGDEYLREVFSPPNLIKRNGTVYQADIRSKYVNVIQGSRITVGTPEAFTGSVHIIGNCNAFGYGVDDSRTIASCLQRLLNESSKGENIRVVNYGAYEFARDDAVAALEKIKSLPYKAGDAVVLMNDVIKILNEYADKCTANVLNSNSDIYFNLYGEFLKPRSRSLYIDETHLSLHGMDRIAKVIFRALKAWITFQGGRAKNAKDEAENKQISIPVIHFKNSSVEQEPQDELASYIDGLKHYQVDESCINGAIVMNCNPFTLGHQYLIRRASEQVDFLYVFVVEEDKSAFSFENRIKLVKSGTSGISNVIVLPSGAFIISTLTFPEYFRKDSLTEIIIDPSMDIEIFASKIAPALNIKKRFAGNEPFDRITKQYNQAMKDILPKYGVEFLELDRYETHGAPISASRVRKLLETSQWDEISELVPNTTFEFLRAVYARN